MNNEYCRQTFSRDGALRECGPTDQCQSCKDKTEINQLIKEKNQLIDTGHYANAALRAEIDDLRREIIKLRFMIDNGLSWEDLK